MTDDYVKHIDCPTRGMETDQGSLERSDKRLGSSPHSRYVPSNTRRAVAIGVSADEARWKEGRRQTSQNEQQYLREETKDPRTLR